MRQVGGALGVAVLGSILSAAYRAGITPSLDGLPGAEAREVAAESIGGTQIVAEAAARGAARAALERGRHDAFVGAMHTTAVGSALVALLGAGRRAALAARHAGAAARLRRGRAAATR